MVRSLATLLAGLSLGLVACGDDAGERAGTPSRTDAPKVPLSPSEPGAPRPPSRVPGRPDRGAGALALPAGVPTKASRRGAAPASRRVIDAWLRALRAGEIPQAAALFAQPSKVQNGTPVLTLDSIRERLAFNLSLPCGARAQRYGTNGRYTIVDYVLTERRGGDCGGAAGQPARGAIRVQDGHIAEWYRLADDPDADPSDPPLPREPEFDPGDAREA